MHNAPAPRPTIEQWTANTRLQVLASSETLGWDSVRLFIERQEAIPENIHIPYLEDDVFGVLLEGAARVHMRHLDGRLLDQHVGAQALQLIPRHNEAVGRWDSAWTYVIMRLNRSFVAETAATLRRGDPTKIEFLPNFYFNDPFLYHLGIRLTNEMQNANPLGLIFADSLTNRLTLYLLRHYSTGRVVRDLPGGCLTPVQLNRLDEYIHANLDQRISLADLAACLYLSVPHFERVFRATTHVAPYRYVLELRLERTRVLLARTQLSIAEVALQCGFSSQSHFTTHFTRYAGVSPARFVRRVRE